MLLQALRDVSGALATGGRLGDLVGAVAVFVEQLLGQLGVVLVEAVFALGREVLALRVVGLRVVTGLGRLCAFLLLDGEGLVGVHEVFVAAGDRVGARCEVLDFEGFLCRPVFPDRDVSVGAFDDFVVLGVFEPEGEDIAGVALDGDGDLEGLCLGHRRLAGVGDGELVDHVGGVRRRFGGRLGRALCRLRRCSKDRGAESKGHRQSHSRSDAGGAHSAQRRRCLS